MKSTVNRLTLLAFLALLAAVPSRPAEAEICSRTQEVQNAIIAGVSGKTTCGQITSTDLAGITLLAVVEHSTLVSLKAGDFDGLTGLTRLSLINNSLSSLPAGVFDELTSLTGLWLAGNSLSSLPAGVFDELTSLEELRLDGNSLSSLPAGVFDELTSLEELRLDSNSLSSLPAGVFDELTSLEELRLQGNSLSSLPAGVFDKLTSLTELRLQNNSLSSLPTGVFDELTSLIRLWLQGNSLSSLPAGVFDKLTSLTRLWLDDNSLSSLPAGVFDELTSLTRLSLDDNSLSSLPAGVFDELTSLTRLWLAGNSLSSLPAGVFDELTGLTALWLDDNSLSSLPAGVFDELTSLTSLYLNGNSSLSCLPFIPSSVTTLNLDKAKSAYSACGAGVTVTLINLTVPEGATASYNVVLDAYPTGDVTVTPASSDTGKATVSGALTFTQSNWSTRQSVTVTDVALGSATISHTVSGGGYGSVNAPDVAVKLAPALTLSASVTTVAEDVASAPTVTVTAAIPTGSNAVTFAGNVEVEVSVAGSGTATAVDFAAVSSFTITLSAGSTSATNTFVLTPSNDSEDETDETVTVSGSAEFPSGTDLNVNSASISLTDDDAAPEAITLTLSSSAVAESASATEITVTASLGGSTRFAADKEITVAVGDSSDSATEGTDYGTVANFTITLSAGSASATGTFSIDPSADTLEEAAESVTVSGSTSDSHTVNSSSLSLTDSTTAPALTLSASVTTVAEDVASAPTVTVTAAIPTGSNAVTFAGNVEVEVSVAGSGTATAVDFAAVSSFTITLSAGSTSATNTFVLTPSNDSEDETDETVTVSGSAEFPSGTDLNVNSASISLTDDDAAPGAITLTLSSSAVAESASATEITVTASLGGSTRFAADKEITVAVGDSSDSATEGTDYGTVANFTITLSAGSASATGTFSIDPSADTLEEAAESVTVSGSTSDSHTVNSSSLSLTDSTTAPALTLSASVTTVAEDVASAPTVTVTAAIPTGSNAVTFAGNVEVEVSVAGSGTATAVDFAAVSSFTITLSAGSTSATNTFVLTPSNDSEDETDETVTVSGSAEFPSGTDLNVNSASISLTDDDAAPGAITLTLSSSAVAESASATEITVTASLGGSTRFAADKEITVAVGDSSDSATEGTDYGTVANFTITLSAGSASATGTFSIDPSADTLEEAAESVTVSGSTSDSHTVNSSSLSLTDSTTAPALTLSASVTTVAEDVASAPTVTVTAAIPTGSNAVTFAGNVEVEVSVAGSGTATAVDFAAVSSFTITLSAGSTSATNTFVLTPSNDSEDETDETVTVSGSAEFPSGTDLNVNSASISLTDDDAAPGAITLTLSSSAVAESASATEITVTASLGGSTRFAADKEITVAVGDSSDSATEGTDYGTVANFTITLSAGSASATGTFSIDPSADTLEEAAESVTVSGSTSDSHTVNSSSLSLTDSTTAPALTLSASVTTVAEDVASAPTVTVTAAIPTGSNAVTFAGNVEVEVSVAGSGTATAVDFAAVSSFTITLSAGSTSATNTFVLTPSNDSEDETDETVTVSGSAEFPSGTDLNVNSASISLTDDDAAPGAITLTLSSSAVAESASATEITVTASLGGSTRFAADKEITVAVGDSSDSATEGTDYGTVANFTITLSAGSASATGTFSIDPSADTLEEAAESVTVSGSTSDSHTVNSSSLSLTDSTTAPALTLSASVTTVAEDVASAPTVTVTAAIPTGSNAVTFAGNVEVEVSVAGSGTATAVDFAAVSSFTITLSAGSTSATNTFVLTPSNDSEDETDETVTVSGSAEFPSGTDLNVNSASISLTDDDAAPGAITLTLSSSAVAESASATEITVTASLGGSTRFAADKEITVAVGDSSDSATEGTDYGTVANFTITLSAGSASATGTFSIDPSADTLEEAAESVTVSGSTSDSHTVNSSSLSLTDSTTAPALTLSASVTTVAEDVASAPTVTVTAAIPTGSNAVTFAGNVEVEVSVAGSGTATAVDFAAVSSFTITLSAGSTSATNTFVLTPSNDSEDETDETVTVSGSAEFPSGTDLNVNSASISLTDDDAAPGAITLTLSSSAVAESASATEITVTASLGGSTRFAADKEITVAVGDSSDSATEGTDYGTVANFTITLSAGSASATGTFSIDPSADTLEEAAESVTVSGSTSDSHTVNSSSLSLTDSTTAPALTLSASVTTVAEDVASAPTVTVTAAIPTGSNAVTFAGNVEVEVSVAGSGTATAVDFAAVSSFTITLSAGSTSATNTFVLTPSNDSEDETDETVTVSGSAEFPSGTDLNVNSASISLTDDDAAPGAITLTLSSSAVAESASATEITVTASLGGSTRFAADKEITVAVGDSSDSATEGTDYGTVANFTITLSAGSASATGTFSIDPSADTLEEAAESVTVSGSTSDSHTVNSSSLSLTDSTTAPALTLSASVTTVAEDVASAPTVTVTAAIPTGSNAVTFAGNVEVEVSVAGSGTATAVDFAAVSSFTITLSAGSTSATNTFVLTPSNDSEDETDETVTVSGSAEFPSGTDLNVNSASISLTDDDAAPGAITLTLSSSAVAESASATEITVTASLGGSTRFAADKEITVAVGDSSDSATEGTDYGTVANFTITLSAGSASATGTFSIDPSADTLEEAAESVTVSGSTSDSHTVNSSSLSLTDSTTAPALTLSASVTTVAEDVASAPTVTVTAAIPTGSNAVTFAGNVEVEVSVAGSGTATAVDFAAVSSFTITLSAGSTSATNTFVLTPSNDSEDETDETVTVSGSAEFPSGTDLNVNSASISLTDDDAAPGAITLTLSSSAVAESASATEITVTASLGGSTRFAADKEITVAVGDSSDSATEGTDYGTVANFTITLSAGSASATGTFSIDPSADTLEEAAESVTVSGSTSDSHTVNSSSLSLTDSTTAPALTLSASVTTVAEDVASAPTVTVTAAIPTGSNAVTFAGNVEVEVSVAGSGTATAVDFAAVSSFTITLSAGSTSATNTFVLTPSNDSEDETDETVTVSGSAEFPSGTDLNVNSASISLTDDDAAPGAITLTLSSSAVAESASATEITVTASLGGSTRFAADKEITVAVGDSSDSATEGTDYGTVANFTITLSAGSASATGTFSIDPSADTLEEAAESVTVSGSTSDSHTVNSSSLSLTDSTTAPALTLSASVTTVAEDVASAPTVTVTAAIPTGSNAVTFAGNVEVEVSVAGSGTATAVDFAAVSSFTITLSAGSTSATNTFVLTPSNDSEDETDETVTVSGSAEFPSGTDLNVNSASISLTDDDAAPGAITLTLSSSAVAESASATEITVTASLGGSTRFAADKEITVAVGDSSDSATEGTDYGTVANFTITLSAGSASATGTFSIDPTQDALDEGTGESVSVSGSTSANDTVNGATLTITDDDAAPGDIGLTLSSSAVAESASATTITVTAALGGNSRFTADKAITIAVGASGDGATEGTDYDAVADFTITLSAGSASATGTFSVDPTQDVLDEGTGESVSVSGSTSANDTVNGATLTITDDDVAPGDIGLTLSSSTVDESASATDITVTAALEGSTRFAADKAITVAVGADTDSATEGTDYDTVADFTITLSAGSGSVTGTFSMNPTQDALDEGTGESVSVSGSTSANDTVNGATLIITDDDATPGVNLSLSVSSVSESASATTVAVTAALTKPGGSTITFPDAREIEVSVGSSGDGATEGTDYGTVADFTITLSAGSTSATGTFSMDPTQDSVYEGDETVSVTGTSSGLTVNEVSPKFKITDDDTSPGISLTLSNTSISEGASATTVTVTAELTKPGGTTITFPDARKVSVSVGDSSKDTAGSGDYGTSPGAFTVTISAGSTSATGTFVFTPTDDSVDEADETVTVTGTLEAASASAQSSFNLPPGLLPPGLIPPGLTPIGGGPLVVAETTLTILDNDETPDIDLGLSASSVSESASATTVTVTATLTKPGGKAITFPDAREVTVSVGADTDGAAEGTDYSTVSDFTITLSAGSTSATGTFSVDPTQDVLDEGTGESVSVTGSATGPPSGETVDVTGTTFTITDDDAAPGDITLTLSSSAVGESASATTITVTAALGGNSRFTADKAITIAVGASGDGATEGTDYDTVADFTITLSAGSGSVEGTFSIDPTQDVLDEGIGESVSVSGSTSANDTVNGATLTITDDDAAPGDITLTLSSSAVGESASATTITVTAALGGNSRFTADKAITVAVGASGDGATEGTDYDAVADFTITLSAGSGSVEGTFSIDPTQDVLDEGTGESVSVSGSTSANDTVNGATLTITDDDAAPGAIGLTLSSNAVAESASATTITVTAALGGTTRFTTDKAITVAVGASGDGATEGTDYDTVADFTITLSAGSGSATGTFSINPTQDALDEGTGESVSVSGSTSESDTVNGTTLTITDDDAAPGAIGLTLSSSAVLESASATTITVTAALGGNSRFTADKAITVAVGASGDSATEGTDYDTVADFTITLSAGNGSVTGTFSIDPTQDVLDEGTGESVSVSGSTSANDTVNGATLTITDDDAAPGAIGLTLSSSAVLESASATTITVTVALGGNSRFTADKAITVAVGASGDSATEGTDYSTVADFTITLSAGSGSATGTFSINPTQDALDEGTGESVSVSGSTSANDTVNGATLTITDDDATPGDIGLTLSSSAVLESASATTITVTVALGGNSRFTADKAITVAVGASGDSATEGTDYSTVADFTITLSAGSGSATGTFSINPTQDALDEGTGESVSVSGSTSESDTVNGTTLTITDDDAAPGAIGLTLSSSAVLESASATTITVTVALGGNSRFTADKAITVAVGASGDSATEGTDYSTVADFTITLSAGSGSATGTFSINPTQDALDEGTGESVSVSGSTSANDTVNGATLTITDDDAAPGDIGLTLSSSAVLESASATTITVTAALGGNSRFTADKAITVAVGASGDSATEGTDYSTVADFTITLSAGSGSATGTFSINPTQDALDEGTGESVSVSGSTSANDTVNGATLTITDDDATPGDIGLTLSSSAVLESASATTITVTAALGGNSRFTADKAITVAVGVSGDGATEGTDYGTVADFTITLSAGSGSVTGTFSMDPTQDALDEGPGESVSVSGSTSANDTVNGATLTITDDDAAPGDIGLTLSSSAVLESASATTITVTAALGGSTRFTTDKAITVAVGASGDGATEGTDYGTVADFTITLSAGSGSATGTFSINPTQDALDEGTGESVSVSGSTSANDTVNGATLTITDDDATPGDIGLTLSSSAVLESASATTITVTAALGGNSRFTADKAITVAVGASGDGATEGTDYATVADFTITLSAGSGSVTGTFSMDPTQDALDEGTGESVSVSGSTSANDTVNGATLTITDDDAAPGDIGLTLSSSAVLESASATTITVTAALGGATRFTTDKAITVAVGASGDGATEGTDYGTVADFTITLSAGSGSVTGTFSMDPTQDALDEGTGESVSVSGSTSANDTVNGATLTITDDDAAPGDIGLMLSSSAVLESASSTTITVTAALGGNSRFTADKAITVAVGASGDGATEGTDYGTVADFTITLSAGSGSVTGTFSMDPTQDALDEGTGESVSVSGSTSANDTVNGATLTITDDDAAPGDIGLTLSSSAVLESASSTTITVTAALGGNSRFTADKAITVAVGASGDGATEGTDYATVADFTITLSAGSGSVTGTFSMDPTQDALDEGTGESVSVSGSTSANDTVNGATLTITDDDAAPGDIGLTLSPSSVAESASATDITVTAALGGNSRFTADKAITVAVGASGDGATEGTDYGTVADFTITLSAGSGSVTGTFSINPTQDVIDEGADESVTVSGSSGSLTVNPATFKITDDDNAPTGLALALSPNSVLESASATTVTVTARTQGGTTYSTDKAITVAVGADTDSATEGTDYATVADFTITLSAGSGSVTGTFSMDPTQDALDEGTGESVSVSGSTSANDTVNGATLTITDDDAAPGDIGLTLSPSSVAESASATDITVTAALGGSTRFAADKAITVAVGASGDGATEGTDYAAVNDFTMTLSAGSARATGTFSLTPVDDNVYEGNETVSVSGTSDSLTISPSALTLREDDTKPPISLKLSTVTVRENGPAVNVTVTAELPQNGSTYPDDKQITVVVGAGGSSATEGTDYETVPDFTVTLSAGSTSVTGTFDFTPKDDQDYEPDETVRVTGSADGVTVSSATITLESDDPEFETPKALSVAEVVTDESAQQAVFTVSLSGESSKIVTVDYATSDGTATDGADYTGGSGSLTFAPGDTEKTISFSILDDSLDEEDETFAIVLANPVNATLEAVAATAVIVDDDDVPVLSMADVTVAEDAGTAELTASLGVPSGKTVSVDYATSDGTAVSGSDYEAVSGNLIFTPGETEKTISVRVIDDMEVESEESFTVKLSGESNVSLADASALVTIEDDDKEKFAERLKKVNEAVLPEISRAMATSTVSAVVSRVGHSVSRSVQNVFGFAGDVPRRNFDFARDREFHHDEFGLDEHLYEDPRSWRETLGESFMFSLAGGIDRGVLKKTPAPDPAKPRIAAPAEHPSGPRRLGVWVAGDYMRVSGPERRQIDWDGRMLSGHLGADLRLGSMIVGVMASRSEGAFDYTDTGGGSHNVGGRYTSRINSVHPYLGWSFSREGTGTWVTAGYGSGEIEIDDRNIGQKSSSDAKLWTVAGGGTLRLLTRGSSALALKAEAWLSNLKVEDNEDLIRGVEVRTNRVKVALSGSRSLSLGSGTLTPSVELGLRRDGGDGYNSLDSEVGAGLTYVSAAGGITVEVNGRSLLFGREGQGEWGVGGLIQYDRGADKKGLMFSVLPSYGDTASGVRMLWDDRRTVPGGGARGSLRLETEIGYGIPTLGGSGLITPYGTFIPWNEGDGDSYRVGSRLEVGQKFEVSLEGRREGRGDGVFEHGLMLRGSMRW